MTTIPDRPRPGEEEGVSTGKERRGTMATEGRGGMVARLEV